MNFDAPSLPPMLVPECDPPLGLAAEPEMSVEGLAGAGLPGLWMPARRGGSTAAWGASWVTYDRLKRLIDITCSLLIIVILSPLFPVIALLIVATSRGSALFRQRRLGHEGRPFWCLKFRTMVADAEEQLKRQADLVARFQDNFKIKDDPRVTRVGAFLRKTSLDELPQLFNVLRGDISLIGPRPIVEKEQAKYGVYAAKLLSVKPGLSGMWQVYGRSDTTYPQRIAMDMAYIDNRSLRLDLRLMVLTAYVVLRGRGAY
jgi:lipopolysaccharide/colanic/teichoic acid biosynthesis glycosyltransferase